MAGLGPSRYWLVIQVWGESFTRSLTDIALPALLSPGNIPALARSRPTTLKLYTTEPDRARIDASPALAELSRHVHIDYHSLDAVPAGNKYEAMTSIQRSVVTDAFDDDAALIWVMPDSIWSDGSLATVARLAEAGARAVLHAGIRVTKSAALPAVTRLIADRPSAEVSARALVRLAIQHMHPYYRSFYWNAPAFNRCPVNIFWPVGQEGLILRAFHLHPLMLYPEVRVETFTSTFDDDLPLLACPSRERIAVVRDSDDAFEIDLAEDNWVSSFPTYHRAPTPRFVASHAFTAANLHHRSFAAEPIRIHAAPFDARWPVVERRSGRIISRADAWLNARYVLGFLMVVATAVPTAAIRAAMPNGIGWHLLPPGPHWHRHWRRGMQTLGLHRCGDWPANMRRYAFRYYLYVVLGKHVANIALHVEPPKPWNPLKDVWLMTIYPWGYARFKAIHVAARRVRRRGERAVREQYKESRRSARILSKRLRVLANEVPKRSRSWRKRLLRTSSKTTKRGKAVS